MDSETDNNWNNKHCVSLYETQTHARLCSDQRHSKRNDDCGNEEMTHYYIGVDPGTHGGCAVIFPSGIVKVFPLKHTVTVLKTKSKMGNAKKRNNTDMASFLKDMFELTRMSNIIWDMFFRCVIEKVNHGGGGNFADKTGQLMKNYGRILGLFEAFETPVNSPTPMEWQKWVKQRLLPKTKARLEMMDAETKDYSFAYCAQYFPEVDLTLGNKRRKGGHDGCADALCMADYGRQNHESCFPPTPDPTPFPVRRNKVRKKYTRGHNRR